MVTRVLRDISCKLGHADLIDEITLERGIQDLSLRRLQTIHYVRNRTLQIVVAEVDQILVDEVIIRNLVSYWHLHSAVISLQPLLAIVCSLLVERQIDRLV